MPRKSGVELIRDVKALRPNYPLLRCQPTRWRGEDELAGIPALKNLFLSKNYWTSCSTI